jgi:hypothetical protein
MIVALHLECDGPAIADIDDSSVLLARFDENVRAARRKFFEFFARVFIGTVLAPHDRENAELSEVRFASEDFFDALEFLRRQSMFRHEVGRDRRIDTERYRIRTRSQSNKTENTSNTSAVDSVKQGKASFCKPAAPWLKVSRRYSSTSKGGK